MASYPGAKVHRVSRRNLGRGQHVQQPPVVATPVATTTTVVITLSVPCVVSGNLNLHLAGTPPTLVSQTVNSPTQITQVYSATVVSHAWSILSSDPSVKSFQGELSLRRAEPFETLVTTDGGLSQVTTNVTQPVTTGL